MRSPPSCSSRGAGVLLLHKRDAGARTVRLTYGPDGGEASRFAAVREARKALSGAERVWRVEGEAREPGAYYGTDLSFDGSTQRYPVEVGPAEMPGISTNAEVWGIKTGAVRLFFLPEAVLSYREDQYRGTRRSSGRRGSTSGPTAARTSATRTTRGIRSSCTACSR